MIAQKLSATESVPLGNFYRIFVPPLVNTALPENVREVEASSLAMYVPIGNKTAIETAFIISGGVL